MGLALAACGGGGAPAASPAAGARVSAAPASPTAGTTAATPTGPAGTPATAPTSAPHPATATTAAASSDPKQAVPVAQTFVDDPRILAELGDFASPASMAASPTYQRAKMVQFGFSDSHPDFTRGGEFMFSIVLTPQQDAAFLAETAFRHLGKVQAVLYRNTDGEKVTQQVYVDTVKELGGEVVAIESYRETEKDFTAILSKVHDARPEVLVLISNDTDGALITRQVRAMGIEAKVVATGACYSPRFLTLGGNAANGVVLATGFFPDNPRPAVQRFVKSYQDRYHETPDQVAALAYDAVMILAWATDRGGFDRVGIQRAMAAGTNIPSVIDGPFTFGPDRRVENARAVPIQVKDGRFVLFPG